MPSTRKATFQIVILLPAGSGLDALPTVGGFGATGAGIDDGVGCDWVGKAPTTPPGMATPLLQTNFFPDLIQV